MHLLEIKPYLCVQTTEDKITEGALKPHGKDSYFRSE